MVNSVKNYNIWFAPKSNYIQLVVCLCFLLIVAICKTVRRLMSYGLLNLMFKAVNFFAAKNLKNRTWIAANNAKFAANSRRRVLTVVLLYTHLQHSVNWLFASTNQHLTGICTQFSFCLYFIFKPRNVLANKLVSYVEYVQLGNFKCTTRTEELCSWMTEASCVASVVTHVVSKLLTTFM